MAQETQTGRLYQPWGVGWSGRLKAGSKWRGCMYTYCWFMLRFDRKQQNSVKQLSFNKNILKKVHGKKNCILSLLGNFTEYLTWVPVHLYSVYLIINKFWQLIYQYFVKEKGKKLCCLLQVSPSRQRRGTAALYCLFGISGIEQICIEKLVL